jgi:DNA polymerase epsilon subunit 1
MNRISISHVSYVCLSVLCFFVLDPFQVGMETMVEEWLIKKYEGVIYRIVREKKEDLKMPNHLLGHRRLFLQLCFRNVTDLLTVRSDVMPLALANSAKRSAIDAYAEVVNATEGSNMDVDSAWGAEASTSFARDKDPRDAIIDIREFDVPYYLRVAMDNEIRVGLWYTVTFNAGQPTLTQLTERVKRPDPVVLAYDIETTKAPLKFPDQAIDQVMMISYMVDGQGYLITNREIVSQDIEDFEYTPKEGYEGPFIVFNEPNEVSSPSKESACIYRYFHISGIHNYALLSTYSRDKTHSHGYVQRRLFRFSVSTCPCGGPRNRHVSRDGLR